VNLSGRVFTKTGDKVSIGGFIIQGSEFKRILVRGLGPSVRVNGNPVPGALQNPVLELHDSTGGSTTNDDWRSMQESEIQQTGLAPSDDKEAAILISLRAGSYTAIIRGAGDSTGIGLIEVYDLQSKNSSHLGNLSVRAEVGTDDNVLIDGLIIQGDASQRVIVRAIGPSLHESGVPDELRNPFLELHDGNGGTIATNDDWRSAPNAAEIQASGLAPSNDKESAILMPLGAGNYTTIVRGVNGTTGVAVSEAYKLNN